jgi:hypothetical protein
VVQPSWSRVACLRLHCAATILRSAMSLSQSAASVLYDVSEIICVPIASVRKWEARRSTEADADTIVTLLRGDLLRFCSSGDRTFFLLTAIFQWGIGQKTHRYPCTIKCLRSLLDLVPRRGKKPESARWGLEPSRVTAVPTSNDRPLNDIHLLGCWKRLRFRLGQTPSHLTTQAVRKEYATVWSTARKRA